MMSPKKTSKDAPAEQEVDPISRAEQLEHLACRSIVMRLADLGPGFRSPDSLPRFLDVVRQTYRPSQSRELESILRMEPGYDTYTSRAYVYAERVPRGVPVLWPVLAFAADRASQRLKVRLVLFYEEED